MLRPRRRTAACRCVLLEGGQERLAAGCPGGWWSGQAEAPVRPGCWRRRDLMEGAERPSAAGWIRLLCCAAPDCCLFWALARSTAHVKWVGPVLFDLGRKYYIVKNNFSNIWVCHGTPCTHAGYANAPSYSLRSELLVSKRIYLQLKYI